MAETGTTTSASIFDALGQNYANFGKSLFEGDSAKFYVGEKKGTDGKASSFIITDKTTGKTTPVTVEELKSGNWNPIDNSVNKDQYYTINADGTISTSGKDGVTVPSGSTGTVHVPSADSSDNLKGTLNDGSTGGTGTSTTPSTGGSGSTTDDVEIDFDQIDNVVADLAQNFKKINTGLNGIIESFRSMKNALKSNDLDPTINKTINSCKKRITKNENKSKRIQNAINSDTRDILITNQKQSQILAEKVAALEKSMEEQEKFNSNISKTVNENMTALK